MKSRIQYPRLGFRNATIEQKLSTCGRFLRAAAALPTEKRKFIPLSELEEDIVDAKAANALVVKLRAELKAALTGRDTAVHKVCEKTSSYARTYAICAAIDEAEVRAAGLEPERSKRVRTGPPGVPTYLRATAMQGAVKLLWKNPMRRSIFIIEYKEGSLGDGEWVRRSDLICARAKITISNLKPGVQYFFRIQAENSNGKSPWSDAVGVRPL
jgi:Fibronectin type III domain